MIGLDKKRIVWLACLLLALGTLALYWPVRHYDFVQYDDNEYVFNNPDVRAGLSWWGLEWAFVDAHASNWHPLTWLSHMLDCQLFGLNPGPQHLVNVALHCANSVLLFLLLRYMTKAPGRSLFAAALFAAHPLRVESVAWISERKDVLSGLFFMLTIWAYARYAKTDSQGSDNGKSSRFLSRSTAYWLALILFTLGLLSKPMLVTVPLVLLLIDCWPLNRMRCCEPISTSPANAASYWIGELLKEKWPFFLLATVAGLITVWAQGKAVVSVHSLPIQTRIESSLLNYTAYIGEVFWPRDLAVLYLRPESFSAANVMLSLLILIAITVLTALRFRHQAHYLVGWLWFLVMLFPVSGLIQTGLQSIADRYTYLPSIGLSLIAAWAGWDCLAWLGSIRARQTIGISIAALTMCLCVALTHKQLLYWQNTETLMNRALEVDPKNYIAHSDLGIYLSKHGRPQEALFHYERARELDPEFHGIQGVATNNPSARDAAPAQ